MPNDKAALCILRCMDALHARPGRTIEFLSIAIRFTGIWRAELSDLDGGLAYAMEKEWIAILPQHEREVTLTALGAEMMKEACANSHLS